MTTKSERFELLLTPEQKRTLEEMAQEKNRSSASVIRDLLDQRSEEEAGRQLTDDEKRVADGLRVPYRAYLFRKTHKRADG